MVQRWLLPPFARFAFSKPAHHDILGLFKINTFNTALRPPLCIFGVHFPLKCLFPLQIRLILVNSGRLGCIIQPDLLIPLSELYLPLLLPLRLQNDLNILLLLLILILANVLLDQLVHFVASSTSGMGPTRILATLRHLVLEYLQQIDTARVRLGSRLLVNSSLRNRLRSPIQAVHIGPLGMVLVPNLIIGHGGFDSCGAHISASSDLAAVLLG